MDYFFNDKYKLLKYLYDERKKIYNQCIVIMTQDELAKSLNFGKRKVNLIVNELLDLNYLDKAYKVNGSYKLSTKTIAFFDNLEKVGEI